MILFPTASPIALQPWILAHVAENVPLITEAITATINDDATDKVFYGRSSYLGSIQTEHLFVPWNLCSSTGYQRQVSVKRSRVWSF